MTREEIINEIKCILSELNNGEDAVSYLTQNDVKWLNENIKTLEQQPCSDAISRDETVRFLANHSNDFKDVKIRMAFQTASSLVNNPRNLPSVQPKYSTSEWCHDCKEYNQDKHCCPRFNRVIRDTVEEIKQPKVGHWMWDCSIIPSTPVSPEEIDYCGWVCSECKQFPDDYDWDDPDEPPHYRHCPNCGCLMESEEE